MRHVRAELGGGGGDAGVYRVSDSLMNSSHGIICEL